MKPENGDLFTKWPDAMGKRDGKDCIRIGIRGFQGFPSLEGFPLCRDRNLLRSNFSTHGLLLPFLCSVATQTTFLVDWPIHDVRVFREPNFRPRFMNHTTQGKVRQPCSDGDLYWECARIAGGCTLQRRKRWFILFRSQIAVFGFWDIIDYIRSKIFIYTNRFLRIFIVWLWR